MQSRTTPHADDDSDAQASLFSIGGDPAESRASPVPVSALRDSGRRRHRRIPEEARAMWCDVYTPSLFALPAGASPAELERYLAEGPPIVRRVVRLLCDMAARSGRLDDVGDALLNLYVRSRRAT